MPSASNHPVEHRLARLGQLRDEITALIASGANDDARAMELAAEFIMLQDTHIHELTDELASAHRALRLASIPTHWMPST